MIGHCVIPVIEIKRIKGAVHAGEMVTRRLPDQGRRARWRRSYIFCGALSAMRSNPAFRRISFATIVVEIGKLVRGGDVVL
jgi:hypothetical protein